MNIKYGKGIFLRHLFTNEKFSISKVNIRKNRYKNACVF